MPWFNYRPRYRYRRYRRRWRRPRAPFFRRFHRRNWVRRRRYHRKLKKIRIKQYQPSKINKCKIKGKVALFETTIERIDKNFDLYELSQVPEHLPGGGGWGLKVFSLEGLYSEHAYCRNVWTKTNNGLPLVRYTGCRLKFWQHDYIDYIITVTNQTPMISSLDMYTAMQPSIHDMLQHKITIPSRRTIQKKRPFKTLHIGPPTQLQNKWYFQQDLAKQPLVMIRATATSLQDYFINPHSINTNINITTINVTVFQNRKFNLTGTEQYWAKQLTTPTTQAGKYYLYASTEERPSKLNKANLIPLVDTMNFTAGKTCQQATGKQTIDEHWKTGYLNNLGNPFYPDYLNGTYDVYLIKEDPKTMFVTNITEKNVTTFALVELTKTVRYNPYSDMGPENMIYFKSNMKEEINWLPPENPELYHDNLPFWLLWWGFADWHKRIKKHLNLETAYIGTMRHKPATGYEYLVPLSDSFLSGKSPYELDKEGPNPIDAKSWHPQLQYQNEKINEICRTGPGTPKMPPNFSVQGIMSYSFYFKWGGSPPPMSTITDPKQQPTYVVPGNKYATNSLQNPTNNPENILWSFDERRGYLTQRAQKRLQKDKTTKEPFITGSSHLSEAPQEEQTPETSSEEEEEQTLFEQLQQQRLKQQRLKHRIIQTLQKIQQLE